MKLTRTRLLPIMLLVLFVVAMISSCMMLISCKDLSSNTEIPYNAKLFDNMQLCMNNDYLEANKTHYPMADDGLPDTICREIKCEEDLFMAFDGFPEKVDFENEQIILYFFTDIYMGFGCELKDVSLNESILSIIIFHKLAPKDESGAIPPCTSSPQQRCIAVRMDILSFLQVNVNIKYD